MIGPTLKLLEQYETHDFVIKKQSRPKTCPVCFRRIKFSVPVIRCNNCSLRCHPKCWSDVAHICSGSQFQVTGSSDNSDNPSCCQILVRNPPRRQMKTTPYIPYPIQRLVNEIELKIQPGLYCLRSPDKNQVVRNIITKFKNGKVQNLKIYNVHTLTTCLKYFLYNFLRGPPLIPIWHVRKYDDNPEIEFDALPKPNKLILAFLAIHLKMVAINPNSRMSLQALAQNFVPVLTKENNKNLAQALIKLFNQDSKFFVNQLESLCS